MATKVEKEWWTELDLDYTGENNFASFFSSDGTIHNYPAKAVPDMVHSLLLKLKEKYNISTVLDPFVGSGTVALESKYLNLNFFGSDLNPLSILLARTKALTVNNTLFVDEKLNNFVNKLCDNYNPNTLVNLVSFNNIEYWFKESNIKEVSYIKQQVNEFLMNCNIEHRETFALILLTAFSSTIRSSSLTRNGEFKLYRMSPTDKNKFEVHSLNIFKQRVIYLLSMLVNTKDIYDQETMTDIQLKNAKDLSHLSNKKIQLVLTSPPYGDSQSTVAYGQFSRLSVQWSHDLLNKYLGIPIEADNVDEYLLGGKKSNNIIPLRLVLRKSKTLTSLFIDMLKKYRTEKVKLSLMKIQLLDIQSSLENGELDFQKLSSDEDLFKLIKERIRLDFFREINKLRFDLNNQQIKEEARLKTDKFIMKLSKRKFSHDSKSILENKLPFVLETINRKKFALPKRIKTILHFFKELYLVVEQTDKVLSDDGIQAWIVGHRTVLGSLVVNMAEILNDWFESLGYSKITTLHRQYSFKRMPHHINSTSTRNDEIKTMMQEHIIVVQKNVPELENKDLDH